MDYVENRLDRIEESVCNLSMRMDRFENSFDSKIDMMFNRFNLVLEERDRKLGLIPLTTSSSNNNNNNNSNLVLNSGVPNGILNYGPSNFPPSHSPSMNDDVAEAEEFKSDSPLVSTTSQFFAELTSVKQKNNVLLEKPNRRDSIDVPNTVLRFYDATGSVG